jgi:TPP-dependent pyruvate/acetoin dehydrogenase alpha subunit
MCASRRYDGARGGTAAPPRAQLHATMARVRAFELAAGDLWDRGLLSGELHTSIGEEGVAAGVVTHLRDGDAMAVDHRSSGPFVARGVPLEPLLRELVGDDDGLCGGWGGHMHLMSRDHLAVADGIVGAAGPTACGFALAARQLRPGAVAVAFFGEGATNQGMLMEAFNLAVVWALPVLFVCKDSRWAITTRSRDVTGGDVRERAASFGLVVGEADGGDVEAVWRAAGRLLGGARGGRPAFLHVAVRRPDGHLRDDALVRTFRTPVDQARELGRPLVAALRRPGRDGTGASAAGLGELARRFTMLASDRVRPHDPLQRSRRRVGRERAVALERDAWTEVERITSQLIRERGGEP